MPEAVWHVSHTRAIDYSCGFPYKFEKRFVVIPLVDTKQDGNDLLVLMNFGMLRNVAAVDERRKSAVINTLQ